MVFTGVASLPEGKSQSLHLLQLCAKHRQKSTILSPVLKDKTNGSSLHQLYSCLLITCSPSVALQERRIPS